MFSIQKQLLLLSNPTIGNLIELVNSYLNETDWASFHLHTFEKRVIGIYLVYSYRGEQCFLRRFQQLKVILRPDRNLETGRNSLLFTNSSNGYFSCRSATDSCPKRRTFI